jgi:hypothetical protein
MRVVILILLLSCAACIKVPENNAHTLVGSYSLLEWKAITPTGEIVYPYGKRAEGFIQYDRNGMMSMQLQRADRTLLGTDVYDSLDSDLIREAFKSFFSYYGPYSINAESGIITHSIEGCKNPDWVGRKLKRQFTFLDDTLTIRTDSVIGMNHILKWKRLKHQE